MSASVTNPESAEPMMDINTTPLIDVMLVLLIMFIITIPMQTHAVKLDLPQNQPNQHAAADRSGEEQDRHHAATAQVLWNGSAGRSASGCASISIDDDDDAGAGAPSAAAIRKRATSWSTRCSPSTKRANITAMGFVGNEAYTNF